MNLTEILGGYRSNYAETSRLILDLAEQQHPQLYDEILLYLDNRPDAVPISLLVYALTHYPAEPLLGRAINWLINGSFEVAHNAFTILNNIREIRGEEVDKAFKDLNQAIDLAMYHQERWRYDLIADVLAMFD